MIWVSLINIRFLGVSGSPLIFVTRPISGVLMLISFLLLAYPLVPWLRRRRAIIPQVMDED